MTCTCGQCPECKKIMHEEELGIMNTKLDTPKQTLARMQYSIREELSGHE